MHKHFYDLTIRVLLYREDDAWVAHALELDLIGTGATEEAATNELWDAIAAQLSFAREQDDDNLIPFSAPADIVRRWEEANRTALMSRISGDKPARAGLKAVCITLTPEDLRRLARKKSFRQFESGALA